MSETQNDNLNNIIDLSTASEETGYHQNYLGFLCRQGILKGFKTGRNWLVAREDLDKFVQTHQNGISEIADETGEKIPVHVAAAAQSGLIPKSEKANGTNSTEDNIGTGTINIISLSEASKVTGYHQDYLAFLCRSGKLQASKIGRNWITTKPALDEFVANHKNGISEIVDETGAKIPVHLTNAGDDKILAPDNSVSTNNFILTVPTVNPNDKILFSITKDQEILIPKTFVPTFAVANGQSLDNANLAAQVPAIEQPANLELNKLKKSVLNDLEERVSKLDGSLGRLEKEVSASTFQTKFLNDQQKKTLEQPPVLPVVLPNALPRQPLHEKFASNFPLRNFPAKKLPRLPPLPCWTKTTLKNFTPALPKRAKLILTGLARTQ